MTAGSFLFCRLPPAAGVVFRGWFLGITFYRPFGLWVPAPTGGVLFPRRKSTQKGAGDTPDPGLSNRTLSGEIPGCHRNTAGRWPLVIGTVGIRLRLTALGLGMLPYFVVGILPDFNKHKQSDAEIIDGSIPSKGRQPKPDKIPAADQIPGGFASSVAAQRQILTGPIRQQRGSSPKGAGAFSVHFCAYKSGPAGGITA